MHLSDISGLWCLFSSRRGQYHPASISPLFFPEQQVWLHCFRCTNVQGQGGRGEKGGGMVMGLCWLSHQVKGCEQLLTRDSHHSWIIFLVWGSQQEGVPHGKTANHTESSANFAHYLKPARPPPPSSDPVFIPVNRRSEEFTKKPEAQASWSKTQGTLWPPKRRELRKVWNGSVEKENQTFLARGLRPL